MDTKISFFNWSLKKILFSESDNFERAKIKILYILLLFSIIKVLIILPFVWYHNQILQFYRAIGLLVVYSFLLKLLLARSISVIKLGHILLCAGVFLVWSSVFFYGQTVNIITLQFIFIMVLGSFFLISRRFGVFYSVLAIFP
ncbi:MAG: hypothetical protein KKE39_05050, partial [Bacteroidetes bacterium]|nr:hypothetical protein [Bacteroidota bacterium]